MLKKVPISELKVGMYVLLDLAWYEHPFLKNEFRISSKSEIEKIKGLGLTEITIDEKQSIISDEASPPVEEEATEEEKTPTIDTSILLEVLKDKAIEPEKKASLIRLHSTQIMKKLFEEPTRSNIKEVKKVAAGIADCIIKDDKTTFLLISMTNFDFTTYNHSVNVGFLALALAKSVFANSPHHDLQELGAGFFLHDIGKIKIDNAIIQKPAPLTEEETLKMRRHPQLGLKVLLEMGFATNEARLIVVQHHEKMDGTGYPKGLRGEDIHPYARICTVADVFDALTSRRPYRDPLPTFQALKLMRDEMVPHHVERKLFEQFVLLFKPPE
ncbi:MAG: DUF3391 domain-containing protein [Syntrophales bacterium]|nr:DUF3391 domain-containing protein [Syntrophales bacterium]